MRLLFASICAITVPLLMSHASFAQQGPSPELTALAVTSWVSQVAQENAQLRQQVQALQAELQKSKAEAAKPATPPQEGAKQ
jgi:small-conductance mechanosensitive channel